MQGGVWRTWAHVNGKIIGIDMSDLRQPLGNNFPSFWKIFTGVINGKESRGYYAWQDKDGSVRDKFMVCTPVKGTPYVIAATTYMDEFTGPVREVETEINQIYAGTLKRILAIAMAAFLVVAGLVFTYGQRLSGKIKSLTEAADRISVGDLDVQIQIRSDDEIGGLAEAIGRMQESIRLSLERLRKRRQNLS
jgi:methyl-accepting chemotaxis protein